MARLRWREILAEDGTNDGWETTDRRWVISSTRHIATGAVDYWFERCPMLEVEERRDYIPVEEPQPLMDVVRDEDGQVMLNEAGDELVIEQRVDEHGEPMTALAPVLDPDGQPVITEVVWLEVVNDERPPGSSDVDELKAVAQAYEDGPEAYARLEGERAAARQQRRGVLLEQRAAAERADSIAAIVRDDDLLDALAEALRGRGGR